MTNEKKNYIKLHLQILKQAMKEESIIFGIIPDSKDANNTKIALIDKDEYFGTKKLDGFSISITDLNDGLID